MPQLNPAPWLFILLISWITLLLIFKTKITFSTPLNSPTTSDPTTHQSTSWNWPWT